MILRNIPFYYAEPRHTMTDTRNGSFLLGYPRNWSLALLLLFIFEHIYILSPRPFITITTSGANRQDVIVYYDLGLFPSLLLQVYNIGCEPARCRKPFIARDYYTLCIFHYSLCFCQTPSPTAFITIPTSVASRQDGIVYYTVTLTLS